MIRGWFSVQARRERFQVNPESRQSRELSTRTLRSSKSLTPRFQEKPLSFSQESTVPQTDTGGLVENTKALERTREKELGKLIP